jgi:hypothetical protein
MGLFSSKSTSTSVSNVDVEVVTQVNPEITVNTDAIADKLEPLFAELSGTNQQLSDAAKSQLILGVAQLQQDAQVEAAKLVQQDEQYKKQHFLTLLATVGTLVSAYYAFKKG